MPTPRTSRLAAVTAIVAVAAAGQAQAATSPGCARTPASRLVVNVRSHGAVPNDARDDTAVIQRAIERVSGTGGTVLVPKGRFMVDAAVSVQLRSNMTLRMARGASLVAVPNALENSAVVTVRDANRVTVAGGSIVGERAGHMGTTGEWGHALTVTSSRNVVIDGVTARDAWGDGFYIGGAGTLGVTMCHAIARHNRRQGMSITSGRNILIRNSVFRDTRGTPPELGIDVEPNSSEHVRNITIRDNLMLNNAGGGMSAGVALVDKATASISGGVILRNRVMHNGYGSLSTPPRAGIYIGSDGNSVLRNVVRNNIGIGITVQYADANRIQSNTVTGTVKSGIYTEGGAGMHFERDTRSVCRHNRLSGNQGPPVYSWESTVVRALCTR